jgi:hypothetical protein
VLRKVQENQVGLKLNGAHQLLAYTDGVNLLGDNTDTIKKNTETLIDAGREVGLQGGPDSIRQVLIINNQSIQQHTGKWGSTFCCR